MSDNQPLFQAVGIIRGDIKFASERGKTSTVSIQGKDYPLLYIPTRHGFKAFEALTKEVEGTGTNQRLIVYPKFTHFPGRDKQYEIAFQLVGFDRGLQSEGVTADLADFEFKLCGLWQFIPVCQTPCISVFKNFTDDRLEFVKQSELYKRVKFMKGSHIPLIWKDAPVKPFRFNPKIEKEQQGKPLFVSIKAKFLPSRQLFGFDSLLSLPVEEAPKFFKASKKMKAEALQESKNFKKTKTPEKVESDLKSVPMPKKRSLLVPQVKLVESAKEPLPMPKPKTLKLM
ncbi:hypothetical protein H6G81_17645 [Scytonema hofmannii FACHB-248]|uniref:Uncharacterized protein n=1 Tax=Scytonema hofmannii FACHB-248 TaxID=1842502 RepID=A0ABR8GSJ2_9CYAN|nr:MULTISPECIES: hypothetical protein [Nostocales]MBD2606303.1 hypothetical protein [Scytonema hofmannii FACHB-248]